MPATPRLWHATIYPATERNALMAAAARGDIEVIDRLTDRLAASGLCRPRDCVARADEWTALRLPRVSTKGVVR